MLYWMPTAIHSYWSVCKNACKSIGMNRKTASLGMTSEADWFDLVIMKSLLPLLLIAVPLMGCKSPSKPSADDSSPFTDLPPSTSESREQSERRLKHEREIDDRYKAEYAEKYGSWRCDRSDLPMVQTFDIKDGTSVLALSPTLHLRLRFGKMLDPDGDHRDFRTETRYILFALPEKRLGEAEGKLTDEGQDTQSPNGVLKVRFTPDTQAVEIDEVFSGVGESFRQIVFLPTSGSPADANGVPARWQTYHLALPLRQAMWENSDPGRIQGVSNGKIYVEVDGNFYAFPVEKFAVKDLRFQAG